MKNFVWFVLLFAAYVNANDQVNSDGKEDDDVLLDRKSNAVVSFTVPRAGSSSSKKVVSGDVIRVSMTKPGVLSLITSDSGAPLARSYDGKPWEALFAESVECSSSRCVIKPGSAPSSRASSLSRANARNQVQISSYEIPATNAIKENARFLLQASFGPTKSSLNDLSGTSRSRFETWIRQQVKETPSLHRVRYRERVNPPAQLPLPIGSPRRACDPNSRWHAFAFSSTDVGRMIEVVNRGGYSVLRIDGFDRHHFNPDSRLWRNLPNKVRVCSVEHFVGGNVEVGDDCRSSFSNPAIHFESAPSNDRILRVPALVELTPPVEDVGILTQIPDKCSLAAFGPVFVYTNDGGIYLHESRLALLENTVESPAALGRGPGNPNVEMNFVNKHTCFINVGDTSSKNKKNRGDGTKVLNEGTIRQFFEEAGLFVYAVNGLGEAPSSPCAKPSRWTVSSRRCRSTSDLDENTLATLGEALEATFESDGNPHVRDIKRPRSKCSRSAKLVKINIGYKGRTYCFEQVHPQHLNVYDFTYWAAPNAHPGNAEALENQRPNPITEFAFQKETTLVFPSWHPIRRWNRESKSFPFIGRLGDTVSFNSLPLELQTEQVGNIFGTALQASMVTRSCGSPGESANDPRTGSRYGIAMSSESDADPGFGRFDEFVPKEQIQSTVWTSTVLFGKDQLRQRVAWALSQILVASVRDTGGEAINEQYLAFYDIFVRNAFGNYHDVLREVSYSPVMAHMLSFLRSKSSAFVLEDERIVTHPDENYAREIMQLFTTGLWELNLDGTRKLQRGEPIPVYDNDDVMMGARAWTGFDQQPLRPNIETAFGEESQNNIDPMKLIGEWRDQFPKLGIDDTYIGDRYPLCADLPDRMFLRKGATYRFLGASPSTLTQDEPTLGVDPESALRIDLDPSSPLFKKLCDNKNDPDVFNCNFKPEVVLDENLKCNDLECDIDTVRVVMLSVKPRRCPAGTVLESPPRSKIGVRGDICRDAFDSRGSFVCPSGCTNTTRKDPAMCVANSDQTTLCQVDPKGNQGIFYEYIRPACVHHSFYDDGLRVTSNRKQDTFCADPRTAVAAHVCCKVSKKGRISSGESKCRYGGERVRFSPTAEERCKLDHGEDWEPCEFKSVSSRTCPTRPPLYWTDASCSIKVKVRAEDDKVAIVHDVGDKGERKMLRIVNSETENFFRVVWKGRFNCNGCKSTPTSCICNTKTKTSRVFSKMPTETQVLESLHIGHPAPDLFDNGEYEVVGNKQGVKAYKRKGEENFSDLTIFEVQFRGKTLYLRNVESYVEVGGASFRNPVTFHNLAEATARDASYETDALLEHYVQQQSTAPFISKKLIQHLVTSNPSPRYVQVVATAFMEGKYGSFGLGKYGDLEATVAAILLDDEARSHALDMDPGFGQFREPMLKAIHFMRSMELTPRPGSTEIVLRDLEERIGMNPLDAPTVFSYYQSSYSPYALVESQLVAPETFLLSTPLVVGFVNGLFSMIKYGLTHCDEGLGLTKTPDTGSCSGITGSQARRDQNLAHAKLTFSPQNPLSAQSAVEELDLLLTGGRLDANSRRIIEEAYTAEAGNRKRSVDIDALRVAQQLLLASPQFHSSNQCFPTDEDPADLVPEKEPTKKAKEKYKAVVYLYLNGGMDSFNALVPKSGCGSKDLFAQYESIRGPAVALGKNELLDISANGQPCSTFGLHPELSFLQSLYKSGDAIMLANVGSLIEPMEKDERGKRPRGLFAHNLQTYAVQTNVPQSPSEDGLMGRVMDDLTEQGYGASTFSTRGNTDFLVGQLTPDIIDNARGALPLDPSPTSKRVRPALTELNKPSHSKFGNVFAGTVRRALNRTDNLVKALRGTSLSSGFTARGSLAGQFAQVSKLIKARNILGGNRNAFFTERGGFDTHGNGKTSLARNLADVDDVLRSFTQEMKNQGIWDDVVVVVASEFGRTLTSNGAGTDHGWGGNYWLIGGGLKGGKVLGQYPSDLTTSSPVGLGGGRIMPTTSWDAVWNGVVEWFGVNDMDKVLPNRRNFGNDLFTEKDLFK